MPYWELRRKILKKFPSIKNIKKYDQIIPLFRQYIIWPLFKPTKLLIFKKNLRLSIKNYPNPSKELYCFRNIYINKK